MNVLTLIPSATSYGVIILAILSLGSFNIARHIHIRWLKEDFSFVATNAMVKSSIALLGLLVIPISTLFTLSISKEIESVLMGLFFGALVVLMEINLVRKINRKNLLAKVSSLEGVPIRNTIINTKISLSSSQVIKAKGMLNIRKNYVQYADKPDFLNYSLLAVVMVAFSEEFLFRGYLIIIAFSINAILPGVLVILLSISGFAFSHVSNDWSECICKLPLSIFTTINFIVTGSLIGAIITHLCLNFYAYRVVSCMKEKSVDRFYLSQRVNI